MINFGARHILVAGSALVALALAARTGLAADSWRSQSLRDKTVTGPNGSVTTAGADARQAEEELTKADRRQSQQVVRSPADGLVQQLAVYSEGAVLKAADPILVVVPDKGELIVEAQVLNRDAGFVEVGQPVTVKLEAFPFTRYGTLEGKLAWISRDAIQDEKLGPVYSARVTVTPPPRGSAIEVTPGLAASAEIRTETRRVIDYLLSPLERRVSEAGRER
jgi:hemolysin D